MNRKVPLLATLTVLITLPGFAGDAKKHPDRAMIERMEAVPCGAHERGLTGLGSVWASVGVTHVNSDEKLCPQYMLRTDDMEYHVRPLDHKHPVLLPVGREGEFKIKDKDILLTMPEGGDRKTRSYEVVSMNPAPTPTSGSLDSAQRSSDDRASSGDRSSPNEP